MLSERIRYVTELVLSHFPGDGLLDRAFVAAGFCVVQAPDKIIDGDIRDFAGRAWMASRSCDGPAASEFQRREVAPTERRPSQRH